MELVLWRNYIILKNISLLKLIKNKNWQLKNNNIKLIYYCLTKTTTCFLLNWEKDIFAKYSNLLKNPNPKETLKRLNKFVREKI